MRTEIARTQPVARSIVWRTPIAPAESPESIGASLAARRGIAPGFDGMRIWLSLAIVVFHSGVVCYGRTYQDTVLLAGPLRPLLLLMLPMFFALSGFLITGSMIRAPSLRIFLLHRALRIFPALGCEILLSALILGPLVTTLPLSEYFRDPEFTKYLFNIFGKIHYFLPGVFETNPLPGYVNLQLWTIPYELKCYMLFTALMILGISFNKKAMLATFAVLILGLIGWETIGARLTGIRLQETTDVVSGYVLVTNFLGGMVAYLWRDRIRLSLPALVVSILALALIFRTSTGVGLSPIFSVYITVFLGMVRIPGLGFLPKGDYSYGIFLYGFPIQQTIAFCFPNFQVWWFNAALAVPLALAFSMTSWWLVEKRVLALKRHAKPPRQAAMPELASVTIGEQIDIVILCVSNLVRLPARALVRTMRPERALD